jgi:DNA-binding transcriptional regulator YiaG
MTVAAFRENSAANLRFPDAHRLGVGRSHAEMCAMGANAVETDFKRMRRARGLSQQKLAALAGCSLSYVRYLESGYAPASGGPVRDRVLRALKDGEGRAHGPASPSGVPSAAGVKGDA